MDKENDITVVTEADLVYLGKELSQSIRPFPLTELTKKLAYKKNASQLSQEVKIYDPNCKYEVGDLIYKEYDEPLIVNSKGTEHFKGNVVLRVTRVSVFKNFNCEMIEVDYTGGGTFRKHIDYMKKNNTQVLLPSNCNGKAQPSQTLKKAEDPRLKQLPMTEKDLKKLQKNLRDKLSKSPEYFNWNDYWHLKEKQVAIQGEKVKKIESSIKKSQQSVSTAALVEQLFGIQHEDERFELYTLSLNSELEKKYKKNFVFMSPENWGKWHLKEILNAALKDLPVSAPKANLPIFEEKDSKAQAPQVAEYPLKCYLSWREVLSGGIRIPKSFSREFSGSREYIFTDSEDGKEYIVYYYPSSLIFLGLKEFYETHNVPQGTSLTLDRNGPTHFTFTLKKSKKKQSIPKIIYAPKEDRFSETGEEVYTFAIPNKIIYLERETLQKLFGFYDKRENLDLRELSILIFKNFGLEADNLALHYQRAFHLVDTLKLTTLEDVEKTLLLAPEFVASDKKDGIFYYPEKIKTEEEILPEEPFEAPEILAGEAAEEPSRETLPEIGTVGEIVSLEEEIKLKYVEEPPEEIKEKIVKRKRVEAPPPMEKEIEIRPEKEERKKKTKARPEGEMAPKRRKSERKFIEERIELEEFEQEALLAIKAKEKKALEEEEKEIPAKEKKEKQPDFKPFVSEEAKFGLFAEKLKSALGQKTGKKKK